jgi:hypothetical protein
MELTYDFTLHIPARRPGLTGIIFKVFLVLIFGTNMILPVFLYLDPELDNPIWLLIFLFLFSAAITTGMVFWLRSSLRRRKNSQQNFMAFTKKEFHYNLEDDHWVIPVTSLARFEFSQVKAGTVYFQLIVHYKDSNGLLQEKRPDYFSFPGQIGKKPNSDVLNQAIGYQL